jgi:hypothetical protein
MIRHFPKHAAAALVALAPLAAACSDAAQSPTAAAPEAANMAGEVWCTMELRYSVAAQIDGPLTGFVPEASWLIVRDGAYADSATFLTYYDEAGEPYYVAAAAEERQGTYTVTVRSPGFQDWTQERVRVKGDECHVTTQWVYPVLTRIVG